MGMAVRQGEQREESRLVFTRACPIGAAGSPVLAARSRAAMSRTAEDSELRDLRPFPTLVDGPEWVRR